MGALTIALIVVLVSIAFALVGLGSRVFKLMELKDPHDPSPPKGSVREGVVHSFTLGMLPTKKESAKLHPLVYVRGVLFHIGIFAFIVLLILTLASINLSSVARLGFGIILTFGLVAGIVALASRFIDRNLKALSRPDDYISLVVVMAAILTGLLYAFSVSGVIVFWAMVTVLSFYIPWSKIPHVAYFFFSRTLLGTLSGRRGLI